MSGLLLGQDVDEGAPYVLKSKDLRTHGVVLGMTGSGKTGLALVLLEELVREGVPIIALDPKGDLGNLGLLFPDLDAASFEPWADGKDPDALASRWSSGLDKWGLSKASVGELAAGMDLTLYTPGSTAGHPVDVLGTLARPDADTLADEEARRDLVAGLISGLLGLVGRKTDPVRDPAHIVLSRVLEQAWLEGQDPDLESLILQLVDPPFEKVGVFPLDRFFTPDERMDLAMKLNGVIASPSFASWTKGAGLDMDRMLTRRPRTPVSVFALSHLSEAERAFFASQLLGRLLAWSRRQPGTERLRAVLFFDEVAGYLPPHPKNPPTKAPLLTLMKQARAMGLGVVLATQNPVDLDYKALSNAGVWAVGRLRTEQDRKRVLQGIPGEGLDDRVAQLDKRQFLIARAKGGHAVVGSRHAMCFLRGPFTLAEIRKLKGDVPEPVSSAPAAPAPTAATPAAPAPAAPAPEPVDDGLLGAMPTVGRHDAMVLDARVAFSARMDGLFAAHAEPRRDDGAPVYAPALYIALSLRFDEEKAGFVLDRTVHRVWTPLYGGLHETEPVELPFEPQDLMGDAPDGARFKPLPEWMDESTELTALRKRIVDDVYRRETEGLYVHKALKLYSRQGESRDDFEVRVQAALADAADAKIAKLKDSYEKKADKLQDRIERKQQQLSQAEGRVKQSQATELVNVGEMVLGAFMGRRRRGLSGAMSRRQQTQRGKDRVETLEQELAQLHDSVHDLTQELRDKADALREAERDKAGLITEHTVRLEKSDIVVERFGVLWVPVTRRV